MDPLSRTTSRESVHSRKSSHALLSGSPSLSTSSRKGRSLEPEGTVAPQVDRASLSMPPPASKTMPRQFHSRRPSKASDSGVAAAGSLPAESSTERARHSWAIADDGHLVAGQPLVPRHAAEAETESNRLSLSSLYSLGSAIYSTARGAMQSYPSSIAGSEHERKSLIASAAAFWSRCLPL